MEDRLDKVINNLQRECADVATGIDRTIELRELYTWLEELKKLRDEQEEIEWLNKGIAEWQSMYGELVRVTQAKQAKIDTLMLEYCPEEMTQEQKDEWARWQRPCDARLVQAIEESLS